ncbi:hypothetical protein VTJ04DRAFT_4839 [Mycothermus thermophilus]|uniref:uncharacterized protein n=1 Tax=Humicola insolens TaxID=85995 RepID=UPI003743B50F
MDARCIGGMVEGVFFSSSNVFILAFFPFFLSLLYSLGVGNGWLVGWWDGWMGGLGSCAFWVRGVRVVSLRSMGNGNKNHVSSVLDVLLDRLDDRRIYQREQWVVCS